MADDMTAAPESPTTENTVAAVVEPPKPGQDIVAEPGTLAAPVAPTAPAAPASPELPPPALPESRAIAGGNGEVLPEGVCPICREGPFERLDVHINFKHKLKNRGRAKKGEPSKVGPPESRTGQAAPPPPDFSDIDGGAPPPPPPPGAAPEIVKWEAMASMTFDMSTGLLSRVFGPEWQPTSAEERLAVVTGIKNYYESVQMPDIPPGYMLCFICLAYAAPRLGAQPTKTKLQQLWLWLKSKFTRNKQIAIRVMPKE